MLDCLFAILVLLIVCLVQDSYGYMVAFAGHRYAARSPPAFVANGTYTVTSFTLVRSFFFWNSASIFVIAIQIQTKNQLNLSLQVLEFKRGRLQNLYWKRDGCSKCSSNSKAVCLNNQDCALQTSTCKSHGGTVDCSIGIQLAFSGTDRHLAVLNSWYEVKNLRQYSLYGLYSNLRDSLTSQYDKFF